MSTERTERGDETAQNTHVRGPANADFKQIVDQLMEIARHLRDGDFDLAGAPSPNGAPALTKPRVTPHSRTEFAQMARRIYAIRRGRDAIFGNAQLFGEPAWDIMLDLYAALVENKRVSVSSACIGSAAPPTTGLRWLGVLADEGLVLREPDPDDQRRILVRLTERGARAMDEYFAAAAEA